MAHHIHLPKPIHGWREFLGEVGIVFLGVVIALGAEQLIEQLHARHKRHLAVEAMEEELGNNDGVVARIIVANTRCVERMLDRAQDALIAKDRGALAAAIAGSPDIDAVYDDVAWVAATNSQALSHGGKDVTLDWSRPYSFVPLANRRFEAYLNASNVFRASAVGTTPMSEEEQRTALSSLLSTRIFWGRSVRVSAAFLSQLEAIDMPVNDPDTEAYLSSVKAKWGDCIIDPRKIDLMSLRSESTRSLSDRAR